jgi:hypothetical protein
LCRYVEGKFLMLAKSQGVDEEILRMAGLYTS